MYLTAGEHFLPQVCILQQIQIFSKHYINLSNHIWLVMDWNILEYNRIPIHANLSIQQWKMTVGCCFDSNMPANKLNKRLNCIVVQKIIKQKNDLFSF